MRYRPALVVLLALLVLALVGAQAATARGDQGRHHGHGKSVVFVQTNELNGNKIAVYDRRHDGNLVRAGTYPTGGLGGIAAPGTESDRLASQGSLAYDGGHRLLIAVNAGSNTISAFRVLGDRLRLVDVEPSGGQFPASVGVHGDLAYVLNSGGTGIVQGFRIGRHGVSPIAGSARSLVLANSNPPNFLTSPGQVGFTPDGSKLLVTTKASGSLIDVFGVGSDGLLSATPVATYTIQAAGTLTDPKSQSDGQVALCWIVRVGGFYYVTNTRERQREQLP